jgi:chemotaxis protein CheZ
MGRKIKFDESGDSEELQALFDSLAATSQKPRLELVGDPGPWTDSADVQGLFDENAAQSRTGLRPHATVGPRQDNHGTKDTPGFESGFALGEAAENLPQVYQRIWEMLRQFHDFFSDLKNDEPVEDAARAQMDTRQRLEHIAEMIGDAAGTMLRAAIAAIPIQESIGREAVELSGRWETLFGCRMNLGEFKQLARDTRVFLNSLPGRVRATEVQMTEIVMARDFQDPACLIIRRVAELADRMERELVRLLVEGTPLQRLPTSDGGLISRPASDATAREDDVSDKEQADHLLEGLGF